MRVHFTDFFEVSANALDGYGAFNISLVNDLPLFIDPFLLFNSSNPTYQRLHEQIISYLAFLRDQSANQSAPRRLLDSWYVFSEIKQNWLGYSKVGNRGRGLGRKFARSLDRNLNLLFTSFGEERVTRGSHLEKLCLIRDGVGKDSISDFTTNLIQGYLLDYTQKFAEQHIHPSLCREIMVRRTAFNYETQSWQSARYLLPFIHGDFVLLTPTDLLTKEDTWINRSDLLDQVDSMAIALPNEQLRAELDHYLQRILPKHPTSKDRRYAAGRAIQRFPQVIDHYIRGKEDHGEEAVSLSKARVEETRTLFVSQVRSLIGNCLLHTAFEGPAPATYRASRARLLFLKDVIENKGGHRHFYVDGQPIRRESDLQLLYRLTWYGTTSDVSREVNDGRGPADFKISKGAKDKTIVEFKLASNTHLKRNLQKQVPTYQRASDARRGLVAIMFFTKEQEARVAGLLKELKLLDCEGIILIDARKDNKPSGSRA